MSFGLNFGNYGEVAPLTPHDLEQIQEKTRQQKFKRGSGRQIDDRRPSVQSNDTFRSLPPLINAKTEELMPDFSFSDRSMMGIVNEEKIPIPNLLQRQVSNGDVAMLDLESDPSSFGRQPSFGNTAMSIDSGPPDLSNPSFGRQPSFGNVAMSIGSGQASLGPSSFGRPSFGRQTSIGDVAMSIDSGPSSFGQPSLDPSSFGQPSLGRQTSIGDVAMFAAPMPVEEIPPWARPGFGKQVHDFGTHCTVIDPKQSSFAKPENDLSLPPPTRLPPPPTKPGILKPKFSRSRR